MLLSAGARAQELVPGAKYDPAIPTVKQVLGYEPGEEITPPIGLIKYLDALAAAAPDRCRLVEYGRTWEGRPLVLLAIGNPQRIAALPQVQAGLRSLADPRTLSAADADRLLRERARGKSRRREHREGESGKSCDHSRFSLVDPVAQDP